jgi:hypothetical protein
VLHGAAGVVGSSLVWTLTASLAVVAAAAAAAVAAPDVLEWMPLDSKQ